MSSLRILLIGNGGREHALAWKLAQSPLVERIIAVPGNGGTARLPKVTNDTSVKADDYPGLVRLAQENGVNLVVPGPEAPLVDGVEGFFRDAGIPVFGPSKDAARMEGSKTFSKDFMKRHNIPTAAYENFSDYEQARKYLESTSHNVVIKATGLAAGKGVIIPQSREEALQGLREIMLDKAFGSAGDEVVIEEFLEGDELSILTFSDGTTIKSLPPAQDHKRIGEGDTGLNTGGMGCYAPTKLATPQLLARIEREILQPTIDGMRKDGFPFRGCLFTGLMITPDGTPKVLEYNVRFGDPETQTVLPLLESDLAKIMYACAGPVPFLEDVPVKVSSKFSTTVVVAAPGYPEAYPKDIPMQVAEPPEGINIFHAGTKLSGDTLLTSGGRVIAATATGDSLRAAVDKAYEGVKLINFEGMYFRRDIAHRAFRQTPTGADKLTYAQAGVSIDAGNELVHRIKTAVASTRRPGADAIIGGFGGELDLSAAGYPGAPIVVGAIDGVGTKLIIAQQLNKHDTVGIDLVAMNVNDLIVQGAEPVLFLDYFGCSKLDVSTAASFVEGVAAGCKQAGCALVGGETAEMPDLYTGDDYDAAGAAIGVMLPAQRLPRTDAMREGDVLLALASSGVHSNGFSLVRRIVTSRGLKYTDPCPWDADAASIGEALLTPTKIYVRPLLAALKETGTAIKGMAHITGGGLVENIPRMLPAHLAAEVELGSWEVPGVFRWLAEKVEAKEMARAFNNGVGMVLAVEEGKVEEVRKVLEREGEKVYQVGRLVKREGDEGCVLKGLDGWYA
ncbi:hypothetical protein VTJ83DRAFT_1240 [Remersonia thermophila]|uniref:ATP-grasp domain-containing protein n=1 Tax=Remersonia thermophila TaxID=72144 RepID=A0ABR4DNI2_9PEZI